MKNTKTVIVNSDDEAKAMTKYTAGQSFTRHFEYANLGVCEMPAYTTTLEIVQVRPVSKFKFGHQTYVVNRTTEITEPLEGNSPKTHHDEHIVMAEWEVDQISEV